MNRKTSFITAAAVAGVVLTGTTAMAANLGMLNSADSQSSGDSSSTSVVVTTPVDAMPVAVDPQVIDVYIEDPAVETTVPTTVSEDASQVFAVEAAGTVTVEPTATGVLLDGVTVVEAWVWTVVQRSPNELEVTFTSGDVTYVFSASLGADGVIMAGVDQPIVQIVQAPAPAAASSGSSGAVSAATAPAGREYEDDDHDDYDDHDEYEGGEHDD